MSGGYGARAARRLGFLLGDPSTRAAAVAELAVTFAAESGNAFRSAAALGVAHRTLMLWAERYPEVRTALEQARRER